MSPCNPIDRHEIWTKTSHLRRITNMLKPLLISGFLVMSLGPAPRQAPSSVRASTIQGLERGASSSFTKPPPRPSAVFDKVLVHRGVLFAE
jgi:hypothetical protein